MGEHWPFWLGGAALATIAVAHFWTTGRLLAVSGRFSQLVDRMRDGPGSSGPALTDEELAAAMREATLAEFGADALGEMPAPSPSAAAQAKAEAWWAPVPEPRGGQRVADHVLFLAGCFVGGLIAWAMAGAPAPALTLRSESFASTWGSGALAWVILAAGGVLVGFGTRMAGGCTSGHGLCGVSRLQPGSLIATLAFFGTAIGFSLGMGLVLP